jgi:eukaryotic-like serine/threonine-protein kinase
VGTRDDLRPDESPGGRAADWARVDAVFSALLDLPPAARDTAVAEHCGGDETLLAAVRRLLDAERRSAGAFDAAVTSIQRLAEHAVEDDDPQAPPPGILEQIGPWQLTERLGAGGMSVVWKAERNDGQFQQTVAIKLLRRWIENHDTVQRFRAERRILAGLEHPNLARLLDGGVVGEGWPYFVMEYVDGLPITDYCDHHRLDVDARLALFRQVLDVVQYAHRRLVVHRDLKPSNILVTPEGRVKLLDFGIAKVLDREAMNATESELTELGGRPMTPAYASPEQVTGEPITTASDVYALGVLLYQLLTGRSPYRASPEQPIRLREAVLKEIPANPSARVLEPVGDADSQALAQRRAATPARLARRLQGDLDVICQAALRKEPERRYATVEQLAADLERHRRRLPVAARAGNWRYLAGRFIRRNAWGVAAGVLIPLAVFAGLALHVERLGAERDRAEAAAAQAEREASKARQVSDYLVSLFRAADPAQSAGREVTAIELVERGVDEVEALAGDPALQAEMFRVLGQVSQALGQYPQAAELLLHALETLDEAPRPATLERADVLADLGFIHFQLGRLEEAERYAREALAELPPEDALRRAPVLTNLGIVYIITSRYAEAERMLGDAIAAHEDGAPGSAQHATTLNALGTLLSRQGRHPEAIAMLQSATDMRMALFGELHPATSVALGNLGMVMHESGDPAGGEGYLLQALAIDEQVLGYDHPSVAVLLNQLAGTRRELDDPVGSIAYLERALLILRLQAGDDAGTPAIASVLSGLGSAHLRLGNLDAAEEHFEQAIAIEAQVLGPDSRELAIDLVQLGTVRLGQSRPDDAELLLQRGLAVFATLLADDHPLVGNALKYLAEAHRQQGRPGEALATGRRSLEILSPAFGADSPTVVQLAGWVAALESGAAPPALIGGY